MELYTYEKKNEREWDQFVEMEALNGTFLQTRRFLEYHPSERFLDNSLLFMDKGKIIAVCPACIVESYGKKVFFSHKGATFGGLVIDKRWYTWEKVSQIIQNFEHYIQSQGFDEIVLKMTPNIYTNKSMNLFEFAFQYFNYKQYCELNTYIDLTKGEEEIRKSLDRNKIRTLKKACNNNLYFSVLNEDEEIKRFYNLLNMNLKKYGLLPIHTLEEIMEFKKERLKHEVQFYGVFKDKRMLAGGMLFSFWNRKVKVLHAQNLSADLNFLDTGAISYLYYSVIMEAKRKGYQKLSWGISTENEGKIINKGLVRNKESYGSEYYLNRTYKKMLN